MGTPQIFKEKVKTIVLHRGTSEDFTYEWEQLVFVYENGHEEVVSQISTALDSPEDNTLGRMGGHDLQRIVQATEINPKMLYGEQIHENSYEYIEEKKKK